MLMTTVWYYYYHRALRKLPLDLYGKNEKAAVRAWVLLEPEATPLQQKRLLYHRPAFRAVSRSERLISPNQYYGSPNRNFASLLRVPVLARVRAVLYCCSIANHNIDRTGAAPCGG